MNKYQAARQAAQLLDGGRCNPEYYLRLAKKLNK